MFYTVTMRGYAASNLCLNVAVRLCRAWSACGVRPAPVRLSCGLFGSAWWLGGRRVRAAR